MNVELHDLAAIVEKSFRHAKECPNMSRWKSCSVVAGCAAVRMAVEGEGFLAAQMEGVADEARRRVLAMQPRETEKMATAVETAQDENARVIGLLVGLLIEKKIITFREALQVCSDYNILIILPGAPNVELEITDVRS